MDLNELLESTIQLGASDLILKTGSRPAARVRGGLQYLGDDEVSRDFGTRVLAMLLDDTRMERYVRGQELDVAYQIVGLGRFRVNIFHQLGEPALVFRHIKNQIEDFATLNLPVEQMEKLSLQSRGLVLATGVAGSGKSTTLAAMVEYMNLNLCRHIITIEDPIEFVFEDKNSVITQREIGHDSESYSSALKFCLRQAPDVIVIGEMRDAATVEAAINAAETGHLVLSTLHTVNAIQTVERVLAYFPPHQHSLIRMQLSMILAGVISLRLLNSVDGTSRLPAVEILLPSPTVKEILKEGRTSDLEQALRDGEFFGTVTFAQSLARLYSEGKVSYHDALAAADNADELKLVLAGVSRGIRIR
ncbi:MAG: PilT/PilU family type 4a pilus ATPase [Planctomycetota bacterium]